MPTNVRDPRTLVTPDAFEISDDLLGTPLAPPLRRLWALLIDLVVIAVLTAFFDDIALFVWGVVALFLLWVTFQPTGRKGAVSALLRVSTGCLGTTILSGVLLVWLFAQATGGGDIDLGGGEAGGESAADVVRTLGTALAVSGVTNQAGEALSAARTDAEAEEAALEIFRQVGPLVDDPEEILDALADAAPDDPAWSGDEDDIFERAYRRWRQEERAEDGEEPAGPEGATGGEDAADEESPAGIEEALEEVAAMTDAEAIAAWAALRRSGDADLSPRGLALSRRVGLVLAADTLGHLRDRVESLEEELAEETEDRREAERRFEDAGSPAVSLLRDIWEQLGSAIGLWSIYFTVLLTVARGRTVGKTAMGLRVIRLDGEPMTWWSAFERAGGYIAGLATGLLGFAQVYWDPNRQCIHDKIVGTVVIDTRAEKIEGAWQEAWTPEEEEEG